MQYGLIDCIAQNFSGKRFNPMWGVSIPESASKNMLDDGIVQY